MNSMTIAYLAGKSARNSPRKVGVLLADLAGAGFKVYDAAGDSGIIPDTAAMLSLGGDGTFLKAARIAAPAGIPVIGVNFGRLGFLSEFRSEEVPGMLRGGGLPVEERDFLEMTVENPCERILSQYVFNEVSFRRTSGKILGVDVEVGGCQLPTYWADGLMVSTSAGSTAYALSCGGPICMPDVHAQILVPVAPHNLNVRPLLLSGDSEVTLHLHEAGSRAVLEFDNRSMSVDASTIVKVRRAPITLKVVTRGRSAFIAALQDKLYWGEDKRNIR